MKNEYFEKQIELYRKWINNEIRLEVYNPYSRSWEPAGQFTGDLTRFLREARPTEDIDIPKEIYVNIYNNGKVFAHRTYKEAISSVDSGYSSSEYVTKMYTLGEQL